MPDRLLGGPARLARLELRRSLGGGRALVTGALVLIVVATDWSPAAELLRGSEAERIARGIVRQGAWTLVTLVLLPCLLWRSAATASRWRSGEGDWLGARPTGRLAALAATLAGGFAAGAMLLALAALAIELRVGGAAGEGLARVAQHSAAAPFLVRPWSAADMDAGPLLEHARTGDELRLRVSLALGGATLGSDAAREPNEAHGATPAGPTAHVRWRVARAGASEAQTHERIVTSRTWLRASVPAGEGALVTRVVNGGPGTIAVLSPRTLELWRASGSERRASLALVLHGLLALITGLPLALGLGFWMGPGTATSLLLTLWLAALAAFDSARLPAGALAEALSVVGEGRVPAAPLAAALGSSALALVVGLALARAGLRSWRHAA